MFQSSMSRLDSTLDCKKHNARFRRIDQQHNMFGHSIFFQQDNMILRSKSVQQYKQEYMWHTRLLHRILQMDNMRLHSKPCSMSFRLRSMFRHQRTEKGILRKLRLCKPLLQHKGLHHNYRNGRCLFVDSRMSMNNKSIRLDKDLDRTRFHPRCNQRHSSPPRCTLLSSPGFQR